MACLPETPRYNRKFSSLRQGKIRIVSDLEPSVCAKIECFVPSRPASDIEADATAN
jgi:hypothetical protein